MDKGEVSSPLPLVGSITCPSKGLFGANCKGEVENGSGRTPQDDPLAHILTHVG